MISNKIKYDHITYPEGKLMLTTVDVKYVNFRKKTKILDMGTI